MSSELKSCPFCGGRPETVTVEKEDAYIIRCEECGARVVSMISFYYSARDKAVAAWNRRAEG